MKSKKFKHGTHTYRSYCKKAGAGYEVGLFCGKKTLFIGNFLKSTEANKFYQTINLEIPRFAKKYWVTKKASMNFYQKFISHDIYKKYYEFCNKLLTKQHKTYNRTFKQHERKYLQYKRNWTPSEKVPLKRAA